MNFVDYSNQGSKKISFFKKLIRKITLLLRYPFLIFVVLFLKLRKKKDFKYKVSLCLIFKDEEKYLDEWLTFHRLIGVDHFYLYNNNSSDNFRAILSSYINEGLVTLIDWPHDYQQVEAYKDCYERFRAETQWLGFIDTDEFLNILEDNDIKDFLSKFDSFPALYFQWKMFGTSGLIKEDTAVPVIERFTQCWDNLCTRGKCFINNLYPSFSIKIHSHHANLGFIKMPGVSVNKSITYNKYILCTRRIDEIAYLNHYWSKSLEFQRYKDFVKSDVSKKSNEILKKDDKRFFYHELNNKTKDFSIQRWLLFLKESLNAQKHL